MSFPRSAWVFIPGLLLAALPLQADFSVEGPATPSAVHPLENTPTGQAANIFTRPPVIIEGQKSKSSAAGVSPEKAQPVSAVAIRAPYTPMPSVQTYPAPAAFNAAAVPYNAAPPYYNQGYNPYAPQPQPAYGYGGYGAPAPYGYAPQPQPQPYYQPGYPGGQPAYGAPAPGYYGGPTAATPTYLTMWTKPAGFSTQGSYGQAYSPQAYPPPSSYYGGTSSYGHGAMPPGTYMGPPAGYGPPPGSYFGTPHSGYQSYPAAPPGGPPVMPSVTSYSNPYPQQQPYYAPQPEPKKRRPAS